MPAFVASPHLPLDDVDRLRQAFADAGSRPWFPAFKQSLLIDGFAAMSLDTFDETLGWDRAAEAADYPAPA